MHERESAGHPAAGYRTMSDLKLVFPWIDSNDMNTNNELITVIESARTRGSSVKSIRKQKYAPSQFYISLADGKQLGPVNCEGNQEVLDRKYDEAQTFLESFKPAKTRIAA